MNRSSLLVLVLIWFWLLTCSKPNTSKISGIILNWLLASLKYKCSVWYYCRHYNNAFYARVGGVSNPELNKLELELLFLLDFDVTVSARVFESYCQHLEKEMLCNGIAERLPTISVDDVTEIPVEDPPTPPPIFVDS